MNQEANISSLQLCTFELNSQIYGVNLLDVREVCQQPRLTPIYHASKVVSGYINIRGEIHLLLDLGEILGQSRTSDSTRQGIIIFKPAIGELFGTVVDSVRGVETVSTSLIEDYQSFRQKEKVSLSEKVKNEQLITGVCKQKDHLIIMLDSKGFLGTIQNAA